MIRIKKPANIKEKLDKCNVYTPPEKVEVRDQIEDMKTLKTQLEEVIKHAKTVYKLDVISIHAVILSLLSDIAIDIRQCFGGKKND